MSKLFLLQPNYKSCQKRTFFRLLSFCEEVNQAEERDRKKMLFLVRKILSSLLSRGITQVIHTFVKVWHLSTRKFMLLASTPQQGRSTSWRPAIFSLHHFSWMDGAKVFRIMQNYSNKRKILPRHQILLHSAGYSIGFSITILRTP